MTLVRHNTGNGHYYVLDGERADGVTTRLLRCALQSSASELPSKGRWPVNSA